MTDYQWPVILFERIEHPNADTVTFVGMYDGREIGLHAPRTVFESMVKWRQKNRGMSFDEACRAAAVFALGEMVAQS